MAHNTHIKVCPNEKKMPKVRRIKKKRKARYKEQSS